MAEILLGLLAHRNTVQVLQYPVDRKQVFLPIIWSIAG
jgi:hypothetical protein